MNLVFLGPPGAGKGTQAQILSQRLGIPHISTGEIFRDHISKQTDLGRRAQDYSNRGFLVPDDITNAMVKARLSMADCAGGFILDGYPRTIPQAVYLEGIRKIDRVINFVLSGQEAVKRISGRRTCSSCALVYNIYYKKPRKAGKCDACGARLLKREDESPGVVKKRLRVYREQSEPLVSYYRNRKILADIDAALSISEISEQLRNVQHISQRYRGIAAP